MKTVKDGSLVSIIHCYNAECQTDALVRASKRFPLHVIATALTPAYFLLQFMALETCERDKFNAKPGARSRLWCCAFHAAAGRGGGGGGDDNDNDKKRQRRRFVFPHELRCFFIFSFLFCFLLHFGNINSLITDCTHSEEGDTSSTSVDRVAFGWRG